ncbi:MAG: hypothetical protein U0230_17710 [Polyangiales bacterium]
MQTTPRPTSFALVLAFSLGCAHASPTASTLPTPEDTTPEDRYAAAIRDASEPTVAEEVHSLRPIRAENEAIVWDGARGSSRVRVVTWTSWDGYDARVGQEMDLSREVWVTTASEVQEACRAFVAEGDPLELRLAQYLGLPPNTDKSRMVELWVAPADVFRPCADAEIDDDHCGLDFPAGTSDFHRAWITDLRARSYGESGYPWTQLGYTYDWGRDDRHVGASEFVIRAGAHVAVVSVQTTEAYCAAR